MYWPIRNAYQISKRWFCANLKIYTFGCHQPVSYFNCLLFHNLLTEQLSSQSGQACLMLPGQKKKTKTKMHNCTRRTFILEPYSFRTPCVCSFRSLFLLFICKFRLVISTVESDFTVVNGAVVWLWAGRGEGLCSYSQMIDWLDRNSWNEILLVHLFNFLWRYPILLYDLSRSQDISIPKIRFVSIQR